MKLMIWPAATRLCFQPHYPSLASFHREQHALILILSSMSNWIYSTLLALLQSFPFPGEDLLPPLVPWESWECGTEWDWCLFGLCRDPSRQNKSIAPMKSNNYGWLLFSFLTPKLKTTGFSEAVDFRGAFVWVYWVVQASSVIIQPEIPPAFYIVCRSFVTLPNKSQGIRLVFLKSSFYILFQTIVELAETGSLDLSIFCSTCLVNYTGTDTNAGY